MQPISFFPLDISMTSLPEYPKILFGKYGSTDLWHFFPPNPQTSQSSPSIQLQRSYVHMHSFGLVTKARKESASEEKSGLSRNLHKPTHC